MNEISNISLAAANPVLWNVSPANVVSDSSQVAGTSNTSTISASTTSTTNSLSPENVSALVAQSEDELTPEAINAAVEAGNKILQASNKNLSFRVNDVTNTVIISIVDSVTGKVIQEIPTVEMQHFMEAMALQEKNSGKLVKAEV